MKRSSGRGFRSIHGLITWDRRLSAPAPERRGLRLAAWAALAVAMSAAAGTPAPAQAPEVCGLSPAVIRVDERLSATFVGGLAAGEKGRLAVRWASPGTGWLSVWVDFGDGIRSDGWERIVWNAALAEGIEVFEFEVPPWAEIGAGTRARFRIEDASGGRELTPHVYAGEGGTAGCGWDSRFFRDGLDQTGDVVDVLVGAHALAVYDDGGGAALYAGGNFNFAGGVEVNHIAKWDGTGWSALSGPAGRGASDQVSALAVYDDGGGEALYAAGFLATAGGVEVNHIAKWDGTGWSALIGPAGTGTSDRVSALAVYDDGGGEALYAGGVFTTAGGVEVNHIAKWDGTGWSALSGPAGTGTSSTAVSALAVYDDGGGAALYAGGNFTTAGGVEVNHIAKWDGTGWSALSGPAGTGTGSGIVTALAVYDDGGGAALYAGGFFPTAGGVEVNHIAKWDGAGWSALSGPAGTGTSSSVDALAVYDDGGGAALYAGGFFPTAGGVGVNHIAKWDGAGWSALSGPAGAGTSNNVRALAAYDDGGGAALYAGGRFATAGGVEVHHIAKWDGTDWSALSGSVEGMGMNNEVSALAVYDDGSGAALYAGGLFTTAGRVEANYIAKWDGAGWSALSGPAGTGTNASLSALAAYDDGSGAALYAGGSFSFAGGVEVNHIAKWDGAAWSALSGPAGTGTNISVSALAVYDDGGGAALYAGGLFTTAGGVEVNRIAKWDGAGWSALSGPAGTGTSNRVRALAVYDDGDGAALYAGGLFSTAGGVEVNFIAKWDGTDWSALSRPVGGVGMNNETSALAVHDDGSGAALYAGGLFTAAGSVPSWYIAEWSSCAAEVFSDGFESGDTSAWSETAGE